MKKQIIFAIVAVATLASCQKDPSSAKSNLSATNYGTVNSFSVNASVSRYDTVGIGLAGFSLIDSRTGKIATAITGTLALSPNSAGELTLIGVYNFSVQTSSGQIFQGVYSSKAEQVWPNSVVQGYKSYKLSWQPEPGADFTCHALATVTIMADGRYHILIDSGLIEIH